MHVSRDRAAILRWGGGGGGAGCLDETQEL